MLLLLSLINRQLLLLMHHSELLLLLKLGESQCFLLFNHLLLEMLDLLRAELLRCLLKTVLEEVKVLLELVLLLSCQ